MDPNQKCPTWRLLPDPTFTERSELEVVANSRLIILRARAKGGTFGEVHCRSGPTPLRSRNARLGQRRRLAGASGTTESLGRLLAMVLQNNRPNCGRVDTAWMARSDRTHRRLPITEHEHEHTEGRARRAASAKAASAKAARWTRRARWVRPAGEAAESARALVGRAQLKQRWARR